MGFRFRRSIKLLPGLRINVSKSGVSASIGPRGATLNVSERGTRATVGLPGSGLSYSESLNEPAAPRASTSSALRVLAWLLAVVFAVAVVAVLVR